MAKRTNTDPARMEKIVSLCKRRGFIFQSGELYGGLNGCWDYGPLGTELKRNLKNHWWKVNVLQREDIEGIDGSILTMEAVLEASGHVGGFSDPMCDDLLTNERLRADQIDPQDGTVWQWTGASYQEEETLTRSYAVLVTEGGENAINRARKTARQYFAKFFENKQISPKKITLEGESSREVTGATTFHPEHGGLLTEPREFNLMFQTNMGASGDAKAYLRPETAQSIFVSYKNILDSSRQTIPFGIAQIGKAFRNEINPRNFTFRSREFEQMEIEYFCRPEDGLELTEQWLEARLCFYEEIGIPRTKLHVLDVPDGERAFYSDKTYDIEYEFPFGIQELEGVAYRTNYDLGVHQKGSGKNLEFHDANTGEKFLPHVVEPSAGCDRTVLALICEAFAEENLAAEGEKPDVRTVLRFKPTIAPIKAAIFPLLKKNAEQVRIAKELRQQLSAHFAVFYDESGAVGRRYRRQDEIGTPFCITIDFETLGEGEGEDAAKLTNTVTVRERDSMQQTRVAIPELTNWLLQRLVSSK